MDAPPEKIEDLIHSAFSTATPLDLVFDEDMRGKRIYFAVRWKSEANKEGVMERDIFGDCAVRAST